ncbi:MAG: hypothetical protein Q8N99_04280 [Nanoarchaeota archaeon]|nr:hypothetical protein [Nanoarchaeota archaeon]
MIKSLYESSKAVCILTLIGCLGIVGDLADANYDLTKSLKKSRTAREILKRENEIGKFCSLVSDANKRILIPARKHVVLPNLEQSVGYARSVNQTLRANICHNSSVDMYVINFGTEIQLGENRIFNHDLSFYLYPQDFLKVFKSLKFRRYADVNHLGFLIEESGEIDAMAEKGKTYIQYQRGTVFGRISFEGKGYRFDIPSHQSGLQMVDVDRTKFIEINGTWKFPAACIANYISRNKIEKKAWGY